MSSGFGKFGPLVGAIDEGTSSARFIIFKANSCEVVALYQKELEQYFPQEGWVEQDPNAILEVVITCITKAVEQLVSLGGNPKDIIAVGVTNQRETTIVWDRLTGKPLHNAIVWLDMRTSSTIEKLLDTVPNKTRNKNYLKPLCGLPLSPYFSAVKLRWLSDNVDAVKQAMKKGTCCFGTVDTWIIWNLTGGLNGGKHVTDVSNASRTMLMNIENLNWDPLLIKFFEVPKSVLPEIRSSSEKYGEIFDGPLKGVPISGCLGDQQAALVGQMCLQKGQAKATYGTGCFVLYNTGDIRVNSSRGLLTTVAYQLGSGSAPCYALEGSVAVAGAALGWLKENIGLIESAKKSQEIAEKATENGSVVFVPAFSGLYAPYWRQDARGVICGITEDTNSNHIVKASLEAVCFQVRDILDAMNEDCGIPLQLLKRQFLLKPSLMTKPLMPEKSSPIQVQKCSAVNSTPPSKPCCNLNFQCSFYSQFWLSCSNVLGWRCSCNYRGNVGCNWILSCQGQQSNDPNIVPSNIQRTKKSLPDKPCATKVVSAPGEATKAASKSDTASVSSVKSAPASVSKAAPTTDAISAKTMVSTEAAPYGPTGRDITALFEVSATVVVSGNDVSSAATAVMTTDVSPPASSSFTCSIM